MIDDYRSAGYLNPVRMSQMHSSWRWGFLDGMEVGMQMVSIRIRYGIYHIHICFPITNKNRDTYISF